jgi:hypothetical protein
VNVSAPVQKRWNDCKALRDDGMSNGDYAGPLNDLQPDSA